MRKLIFLVPTLVILALSPVWGELKVIVLDNGETLLGEIVDTEDDEYAIRLQTGPLIRLPQSRIKGIEEPPKSEAAPESLPTPVASATDGLDLHTLFKVVNPTPTPLALVPIDLRLNYTRRTLGQREPALRLPLFEGGGGGQGPPAQVSEEQAPEQDFGEIVWAKGLSKYRTSTESWQPALTGKILRTGDELATLSGKMVLFLEPKGNLRLEASTQAKFQPGSVELTRGRAWLDVREVPSYSIVWGGVKAVLEKGLAEAEFLSSGNRFNLLEGKATLIRQPEGSIVRGDLEGPVSILMDENRNVVNQAPPADNILQEWQTWLMADKGFLSAATGEALSEPETLAETPENKVRIQASNLATLAEAVTTYYLDNGHFPAEQRPFFHDLLEDTGGLGSDWKGPYLEGAGLPLVDQWGSELLYRLAADPLSGERTAEVFSLGPNKTFEQGAGDDIGVLIERPGS